MTVQFIGLLASMINHPAWFKIPSLENSLRRAESGMLVVARYKSMKAQIEDSLIRHGTTRPNPL